MPASLVLTLIGEDHPGLVDSISEVLTAHDANWEESRMASLAGKFAGVLLTTVPEANAGALTEALYGLESSGLRVVVERSGDRGGAPRQRTLHLELLGQDRPGIVHDVAHALAKHRINVYELNTECVHASMAGGDLFKANATLQVPMDVDEDALRDTLEGLANEMMVDITLEDSD